MILFILLIIYIAFLDRMNMKWIALILENQELIMSKLDDILEEKEGSK